MSATQNLEQRIADFYATEAPPRAPEWLLTHALEVVESTPQRRTMPRPSWTLRPTQAGLRLALAAAVVTAVSFVGLGSFGAPSIDPTSAPPIVSTSPSASASVSLVPLSELADTTALLNGFLEARISGTGAQRYLDGPELDVPLLYATTSGAPFERGEVVRVNGIGWPYGWSAFKVRLFAGSTVVEQLLFASREGGHAPLTYVRDGFGTEIVPTSENGQPVAEAYDLFEGEITLYVAHPWVARGSRSGGGTNIQLVPSGPDQPPTTDGGERNGWDRLAVLADPVRVGDCPKGLNGADAEGLAQSFMSDSGLDTTTPIAVRAGEVEGLMFEASIRSDARSVCAGLYGESSLGFGQHVGLGTSDRMRLYLFDAPQGSSVRILAIAVIVPESRFERAVAALTPVIDLRSR